MLLQQHALIRTRQLKCAGTPGHQNRMPKTRGCICYTAGPELWAASICPVTPPVQRHNRELTVRKNTHRGARAHDHKVKSLALCRLS